MFHAIAAGKASIRQIVEGSKQPREDLVTSALFGTMEFLTASGRRRALQAVINWNADSDPEIHLWPRFERASGWVEPDVVVSYEVLGQKTFVLIEVKWGAPLGLKQALDEIEGLQRAQCLRGGASLSHEPPRVLASFILLGKEPHHDAGLNNLGTRIAESHSIPWHEVTARLRRLIALERRAPTDHGLLRWAMAAESFLASTSKGQKFGRWPDIRPVARRHYLFSTNRLLFQGAAMKWPGSGRYGFKRS